MKHSIFLFVGTLLFSLLFASQPGGVTQAASANLAIAPSGMVTLTGQTGGQPVANLAVQNQSGSADAPSKYVTFTTPGTVYKGYRRYTLPVNISVSSITAIKVKINYKGLPKSGQAWSWSLYDWVAKKWIRIGDNAGAKTNVWFARVFPTTSPKRFVNAGREIRVMLQSNNATGNAKLDFESVNVAYTVSPTATLSPPHTVSRTPTVTMTRTASPTPPTPGASSSVYGDALVNGWEDWSWGDAAHDLASTASIYSGAKAIAVTYGSAGWSGLQFGRHDPISLNSYDTLRFWVHGGVGGGQVVQVQVVDGSTTLTKNITPQAGTWTQVDVPLAGLSQVTLLAWFNNTAGAQSTFYIDDVTFISSGGPTPTRTRTSTLVAGITTTPTRTPTVSGPGLALSVNVGVGRHPISPYIYGMNFTEESLAAELDLPVRRWGGNSTTRYNWQIDVHNTGSDWYFENIPGNISDGNAADDFIEQNERTSTETLLTVPLIGWVPKGPRVENHPYPCGFKVSLYGAQQSTDAAWDPDCGNGIRTNGTHITGNNPTDTSMAITPSFVTTWINHLKTTFGTAANGGVQFYNLDNEPGLWSETHRDVHPQALTYDEIRDRTFDYAAAIKAADATALTLGPAEDGWCRYFFSAADHCSPSGADRTAHGNVDYVAWYLAQMQSYEQQNGVRILDYFDLHIYPQASGVYSSALGSEAVQALRLRSTRQLWDPTYVDESWIDDMGWQGDTVRLIPRMRDWVNNNYPGTKLAISEYSWGAMGHLNGALAQADVLGIFGREGLDLATLWGAPSSSQPGAYAFRMYRNYDGSGGRFGDTGVSAASADQSRLAVYAAQRSSDSALTLIVINKTGGALAGNLSLAGFSPSGSAQVYRYSDANLNAIQHLANQAVSAAGFSATFPANSITLFVVPGGAP